MHVLAAAEMVHQHVLSHGQLHDRNRLTLTIRGVLQVQANDPVHAYICSASGEIRTIYTSNEEIFERHAHKFIHIIKFRKYISIDGLYMCTL